MTSKSKSWAAFTLLSVPFSSKWPFSRLRKWCSASFMQLHTYVISSKLPYATFSSESIKGMWKFLHSLNIFCCRNWWYVQIDSNTYNRIWQISVNKKLIPNLEVNVGNARAWFLLLSYVMSHTNMKYGNPTKMPKLKTNDCKTCKGRNNDMPINMTCKTLNVVFVEISVMLAVLASACLVCLVWTTLVAQQAFCCNFHFLAITFVVVCVDNSVMLSLEQGLCLCCCCCCLRCQQCCAVCVKQTVCFVWTSLHNMPVVAFPP